MHRLLEAAAQWGSMFDRRRLVGLGLGAALFGLVAVPAFAAPSSVVGRMTGAVGAAIADVPALFAGAPPTASPHASDTDRDTISSTLTTTSTVSASSPATRDAALPPQGLGVIVSTIARSTAEQGEAHGDAVSSAAHSVRTSTSSVASTASTDADGHGDAVSAVAHTSRDSGRKPRAAGERGSSPYHHHVQQYHEYGEHSRGSESRLDRRDGRPHARSRRRKPRAAGQ